MALLAHEVSRESLLCHTMKNTQCEFKDVQLAYSTDVKVLHDHHIEFLFSQSFEKTGFIENSLARAGEDIGEHWADLNELLSDNVFLFTVNYQLLRNHR